MTLARCRVPDMSVRTLDGFGRRFGLGAIVDLDEPMGDSGLTLRQALAERVELFEVLQDEDPSPAAPVADEQE